MLDLRSIILTPVALSVFIGVALATELTLYSNDTNSSFRIDEAGSSQFLNGLGGNDLAVGDFRTGNGPQIFLITPSDIRVLDRQGNFAVFAMLGGSSLAFGDLGAGPTLFANNGNTSYTVDSNGGFQVLNGLGGNDLAVGDFQAGAGPELFLITPNDIHRLDLQGNFPVFNGLGGETLAFGDLGAGPTLFANNGNTTYSIDSSGAFQVLNGLGGIDLAFGNFQDGSGGQLFLTDGNCTYTLDLLGNFPIFSGQGGVTLAIMPHIVVRGDCNSDGGLDVGDPIFGLGILFSQTSPVPCVDACDVNDDGAFDVADPVFLLSFFFTGGSMPLEPFPGCGLDTTADDLSCQAFTVCP